eukprot:9304057-Pyramimonas_sp.AAC.1
MLVNQVGAKCFTFTVWHADVSNVIELRAFPPSYSRCKGAHIESDFEGEMSRAFEFTNDLKVDDHSIGAIIRKDVVDPGGVFDGVVA